MLGRLAAPFVVAVALSLLLIAACSDGGEPAASTATATEVAGEAVEATSTSTPTPPSPATATPTATPVPTTEPTETPSTAPSPSPTPTQTPPPAATATATATEEPASAYQGADCRFEMPVFALPGTVIPSVDCGYLTVPEDRTDPDSTKIRLHVAIFESLSDNPEPDPIVYLVGGPGGKALEPVMFVIDDTLTPFLEGRDFILFDQRGVGFSEPALDCPELLDLTYETLDQDLNEVESAALGAEALERCRARLEGDGANLAAYTTAENAADLEDLRVALGYDQWNLYGVSYGTKLALTAMRDFPSGIRSVVLDSSYPLEVNLLAGFLPNVDRAFRTLFDGCAADASCNEAYPDLETAFFNAVGQLDETPATYSITHPISEESFDTLLNGDRFIGSLFGSLYSTEAIPLLPELIFDAEQGIFDTLALLQGSDLYNSELISQGMHYSVQCGEEYSFEIGGGPEASAEVFPRLLDLDDTASAFAICETWGARQAAPIENEPVTSDIPTLVLAGEYDPITPPAWGRLVNDSLSNGFLFEFPGVGHGVATSGDCPLSVTLAFLGDPTTEPDANCVEQMSGPGFVAPTAQVVLTPFENSSFGFSGVVPESWTEVGPGVYGRTPLGLTALIQQAVPGVGAQQFIILLAGQFGMTEVPSVATTREANDLTWNIYSFAAQGQTFDVGLADKDGGGAILMLLGTMASKRDLFYDQVFLPAIDALLPSS